MYFRAEGEGAREHGCAVASQEVRASRHHQPLQARCIVRQGKGMDYSLNRGEIIPQQSGFYPSDEVKRNGGCSSCPEGLHKEVSERIKKLYGISSFDTEEK